MPERRVVRTHPALRDDIGDLVTRRPLPGPSLAQLDPFLFLNHHGPQIYPPANRGLPFGPHPHRGFETVTFILAGELAHRDSGGHESIIHPGGVQWMTAGRGLVHAELSPESFKRSGGPLEILQLWVNLPARLKMTEPAYRGLEAPDIPVLDIADGRARMHLVSGQWEGVKGAVAPLTDVALAWIEATGGSEFTLPAPPDSNILVYVVRGRVAISGTVVDAHRLAELGPGDRIDVRAEADSVILYGHGTPFGEPIVAHGPFVMNSAQEIREAILDYQAGRLGAL
jgi:quercetin 2,3-dioxygenase